VKLWITFLRTILIYTLLISSISLSGQMMKGQKTLSIYSGFINPEPFTFSIFTFSGVGNPSPSFNIGINYAVTNKITVGPFASYYRVNADYSNSLDQYVLLLDSDDFNQVVSGLGCIVLGSCDPALVSEKISVFTIGAKATITRNIVKEIETYLSMHLGYSISRREAVVDAILETEIDQLDLGVEVPSVIYYTSVGLRKFISHKYALFGEFGYGNSHLLTVGVTMRMGY